MSTPIARREALREILKTHSLKRGDFTLASGRKSNFYFDSKLTTLRADGAFLTGDLLNLFVFF